MKSTLIMKNVFFYTKTFSSQNLIFAKKTISHKTELLENPFFPKHRVLKNSARSRKSILFRKCSLLKKPGAWKENPLSLQTALFEKIRNLFMICNLFLIMCVLYILLKLCNIYIYICKNIKGKSNNKITIVFFLAIYKKWRNTLFKHFEKSNIVYAETDNLNVLNYSERPSANPTICYILN